MEILALTFMAFHINRALDNGRHGDITIDVIRREIRGGTIFDYLATKLRGDIDLSIFDNTMRAELVEEWRDMEATIDIHEKFGIERGGLALMMAFLLEGVQRRASGKA